MKPNNYILLFLSLLLNSFGNAVAINTTVGSVIWTASGQGLADFFHLTIGTALTLYGAAVIILSSLLNRKFEPKKAIGNFLFMVVFSYLVDFLANSLSVLEISNLSFVLRLLLNLLAVVAISLAVSFYQKANIVLHPNDELMLVIRRRFTRNNATKAQMAAYIIPVSVIILTFLGTGKLTGIGVGTVISFLIQGSLIDLSDRLFFSEKESETKDISFKVE